MSVAKCNVCDDSEGKAFRVPWGDHIGPALMEEHFNEKHPEIVDSNRRGWK